MKKLFNIIKIILIIILLVVFLFSFYTIIMSYINKGDTPSVFGYQTAVVISGSMSPAIEVDDLVIIEATDSYDVGDIIAYKTENSRVTHRVIEVKPDGYITQGDANNAPDQNLIPNKNVIGEVVYIIPKVGKAISFLQSPLGMMMVVLLAGGAILLFGK